MKKITNILSGVLAFGITIGLLVVPIYFLRWYEVIAIHFLCFLISFILSKVVTTRKFKDPQNVFIATVLFGMAGLLVNLFEWKKITNEERLEIDLERRKEKFPEFIELAEKIITDKVDLAVKMTCINSGLYRCLEKDVPKEFGEALSREEVERFLKNRISDDEIKKIIESPHSVFKGEWESIGVGGITNILGINKISNYINQTKIWNIDSFSDWIIKPFQEDNSINDPKKFISLNNAYHLFNSYKKDNIEIEPVYFDNTQNKKCYLFWDNKRALRESYTESYNNFKFELQVLKPLLKFWENSSKEDYKKQSYNIWKDFLINEVIAKDDLNSDYEKAFKESNLEFIQNDDFKGSYLNLSQEGYVYKNSGLENAFYGVNLHFSWDQEHDEYGYDQHWSSIGGVPISWNGLVANLPNYYDEDFVNGQSSLGEAKTLDEACKILSELPIADYNKLSEEDKEDISYIKFPHKDDKIEEKESSVELNTDLPDNWGNDSSKKDDEKGELNLNLNEKSKIESTSNYPEQEVPLSEFIDNHGIDETLRKIQNDEKELVVSLKISNRNGLLSCKCKSNELEILDEKRVAEYLSEYSIDKFPNNFKVINPLFWDSFGKAIASKVNSIDILNELVENESDYEDIDELIQEYIVNDCSHNYVGEFFKQENWEVLETSNFCDHCEDFDVISDGMVEGIEHETTIRNKANTQTKVENESLQESAKAERVKSFCTNCGESISANDKFCGSCGTKTN